MEFLQTNWVWLLLMAALVWLLSRGRIGCGVGRRDANERASRGDRDITSPSAQPRQGMPDNETSREHAGHRSHRGC